jgi:hypothetical protein
MLFVPASYSRDLVGFALIAAEALLWVCNVRRFFYPALSVQSGFLASLLLGFPVAFLLLSAIVRTIPRFIPPHLVSRQTGTVTTLGLIR